MHKGVVTMPIQGHIKAHVCLMVQHCQFCPCCSPPKSCLTQESHNCPEIFCVFAHNEVHAGAIIQMTSCTNGEVQLKCSKHKVYCMRLLYFGATITRPRTSQHCEGAVPVPVKNAKVDSEIKET